MKLLSSIALKQENQPAQLSQIMSETGESVKEAAALQQCDREPVLTYRYFGLDIPQRHFDDKFGSYWQSILITVFTGSCMIAASTVLVGRYNGWSPVFMVPSAFLWLSCTFIGIATCALPVRPPSERNHVRLQSPRTARVHLSQYHRQA